ncbi:hypothetical protein LCI18_014074 [Fusarium solani-melongenae]|uniref:Uncharacterized protein n=1 Tax=Fusarium solani subsp. cucurbitae TaxID=2747967 RepID=A0ACD3ZP88_FUSSC|nr:hypothetical protein LCI18_014074 [Fusarium solani-melongenae]
MSELDIISWLQDIPIDNHLDIAAPKPAKRRRLSLPTPSSSITGNLQTNLPKPRGQSPNKRSEPIGSEKSASKRSRGIRSEVDLEHPSECSVSVSGRLSPSKQIRFWKLHSSGISYGEFSHFTDKPKSLRRLLARMDRVMEGFGIVSSSQQPEVLQAAKACDDEFDWAEVATHYFSDARDELGQTPSAAECNSYGHHEDAWNKAVHTPMLELAFHETGKRLKNQLITATSCSIHATIMSDYQHGVPGTSKKVDFVIHVNPKNETPPNSPSPAAEAIDRLVHQLPGKVFNFTDFEPVQDRPIALSIETEKPTEGFDVAKLQLGVWQATHWSFLKALIDLQQSYDHSTSVPAQTENQPGPAEQPAHVQVQHMPVRQDQPTAAPEETVQQNTARFELPDFLPGVIITGHNWWFTTTTFDGSRMSFWEKAPLGSTDSTKEI